MWGRPSDLNSGYYARKELATLEPIRETIGRNIYRLRHLRRASQSELGEEMGIAGDGARTTVWRWEQGDALGLETLDRLAMVLGVEVGELFSNRERVPEF